MNTYKNIIGSAVLLAGMLLPLSASAATLSLSPSTGTHSAGNSYSVSVYADPEGSKAYTAKIEVDFPAGVLYAASFTPAPGTIPLVQPGYDLIDNSSGTIVKTVGFSGGITSQSLIGTIRFRAQSIGSAPVSVSSANSSLLNASNQNIASSFGTASYSITAAAPASKPAASASSASGSKSAATSSAASSTNASGLSAAAASSTSASGSSRLGWLIALGIVILAAIGATYAFRRSGTHGLS